VAPQTARQGWRPESKQAKAEKPYRRSSQILHRKSLFASDSLQIRFLNFSTNEEASPTVIKQNQSGGRDPAGNQAGGNRQTKAGRKPADQGRAETGRPRPGGNRQTKAGRKRPAEFRKAGRKES